MIRIRTTLALAGLFAALLVPATAPTANAAVLELGRKCEEGAEIHRCVSLHYDTANRRYRVHASVLDVPGGGDWLVNVLYVTRESVRYSDPDGYFNDGDTGQSNLQSCGSSGRKRVVFHADFGWYLGGYEFHNVKSEAYVC